MQLLSLSTSNHRGKLFGTGNFIIYAWHLKDIAGYKLNVTIASGIAHNKEFSVWIFDGPWDKSPLISLLGNQSQISTNSHQCVLIVKQHFVAANVCCYSVVAVFNRVVIEPDRIVKVNNTPIELTISQNKKFISIIQMQSVSGRMELKLDTTVIRDWPDQECTYAGFALAQRSPIYTTEHFQQIISFCQQYDIVYHHLVLTGHTCIKVILYNYQEDGVMNMSFVTRASECFSVFLNSVVHKKYSMIN